MPVINRIAEFAQDMQAWRHHLHMHPELQFDCHQTAAFVAARLREFGVDEVHEGLAESGVVAVINGQGAGPTIGLRADMDALPITEVKDHAYKSQTPGKMHACGHDGHTTMLLGAAKYLAETRRFAGRVALIFQPAEEGGGGAKVMCDEGLMERFGITQVYALHNLPGAQAGHFLGRPGPIMAAADVFTIRITGNGAHAAKPNEGTDPIVVGAQMVTALQTLVSRNIDPLKSAVLSVTTFHAGTAHNIIPESAVLQGTVRTLDAEMQQFMIDRMHMVVENIAAAFGATAVLDYERGYPVTVNHADALEFAADVAREVSGDAGVEVDTAPMMGGEDFSYMLEERRGAYLFLGQGESAGLHHPHYDFNDEISPVGASYFAKLVERAQPLP
ncbi:MAG: M20 aminoacylase family protein [Pseudomonadota bacterium]